MDLGFHANILERIGLADGIHAARNLLKKPTLFIHKTNCSRGLACLQNYTRKWDRVRGQFMDTPNHNWASHGADAFRYLALDLNDPQSSMYSRVKPEYRQAISDYDEFGG